MIPWSNRTLCRWDAIALTSQGLPGLGGRNRIPLPPGAEDAAGGIWNLEDPLL